MCFSDKILLFISDAAPYMVLAGKNLRHFYSRAIHVTCVAHGIHRICEQVRQMFPKVNRLLSCSRKILLKSPFRIQKYKEKMQCALPPDVVVTRWGTWLQGAMFFANNFQNFKELVEELPDDSQDMKKLKMLLTDTGDLSSDLAFINSFLSSLPAAITKLETRGLSLNAQIEVIEEVRKAIYSIPGPRGTLLQRKCDAVFTKNVGLTTLETIKAWLINGTACSELPCTDPLVLSAYMYAPIVSVEVERSFSEYKCILTDRRCNFTQTNLEKHVIVCHNKKFL